MEFITIKQVTSEYGVSRRMLSYYEEIGLIKSNRIDDYAYRVYDKDAIKRLQQIIILRKLQIPVKQIKDILCNQNAVEVIEVFKENISKLDEQITALSTLKSILTDFVDELQNKADIYLELELLNDKSMLSAVSPLSFSDNKVSKNISIEELNKAHESLNKLEDKDVRIVYIPPMTIASIFVTGGNPENQAFEMIKQFLNERDILKVKPDVRCFGFDSFQSISKKRQYSRGYEMWISVPNDIVISKPFIKLNFEGGLYAAHVLRSWDFADRRLLQKWVDTSQKYDSDWNSTRGASTGMAYGRVFEETLNFYNYVKNDKMEDLQLDILIPIKEKQNE